MCENTFISNIGPYIKSFIRIKNAAGFPYHESSRILGVLDKMIACEFPEEETLTQEICTRWLKYRPDIHHNGLIRRTTPVRQLGKYMNGIGITAYVIPSKAVGKEMKYEAHIYTKIELQAFFQSVDTCEYCKSSPCMHYVIPVFFRLLYSCGMRSSEVRYLKCEDVDLITGKITIRESKGWRRRVVYMSQDMLKLCQDYDAVISKKLPSRTAFFPNQKGNSYSSTRISDWFHLYWDHLPEAKNVNGNSCRVHDFRHSFAVHKINQWVESGQDLNVLYPYLSEYMGHSTYKETDYYLSLTAAFYPEMEKRLKEINQDILPEVQYER